MTTQVSDALTLIQEGVAEKLGPKKFRVWIKDSTNFVLANGHLRVDVPNPFVGRWIENNYRETISEVAATVLQRPVEILFSVDANLATRVRKKQLDSQAEFVEKNPERLARRWARMPDLPAPQRLRCDLDDFVVTDRNRIAHSAAQSVCAGGGPRISPLCIFGGCGLGKTHLLQGIANHIQQRSDGVQCLYVTGEEFTNHYVHAVRTNRTDAFRTRYRHLDVLLIDDIHFLANKRATQEEFLHTFNAIDSSGRQIVVSTDVHPRLIGQLSESLVTRFMAGMVVEIERPDVESCRLILARKAERIHRDIPPAVIDLIAAHLQGTNIRELEGALLKVIAMSDVARVPITVPLAHGVLKHHSRRSQPLTRFGDIESMCGTYFGVSPAELHSSRRTRTVALARNVAMYLARKHTQLSSTEVGRLMGKDHTTVLLACQKISARLRAGEEVIWTALDGEHRVPVTQVVNELEKQLGRSAAGSP